MYVLTWVYTVDGPINVPHEYLTICNIDVRHHSFGCCGHSVLHSALPLLNPSSIASSVRPLTFSSNKGPA